LNENYSRQPAATRRRFLLVHNPTAGRRGQTLAAETVAELEARGCEIMTRPSGASLDGDRPDAIIAAGGDGTVRALANLAASLDIPVGIVPVGTGNVLATEIGMPRDAVAVADILMGGAAVAIQGGTANGAPFFLMAGAGFDGEAVKGLDVPTKRRFGKLAYAWPGLRALGLRPAPLTITIDGVAHRGRWVVIAKARHYGGSFVIAPKADIRRAGFEAAVFKSFGRLRTIRQLLAISLGRLEREKHVEIVSCHRVTVAAESAVPAQVDGDPFGSTPLVVDSDGPRMKLIVPDAFARRAPGYA
jgi:YegS/Rv2252/BmrU family lipid kinase